jgi:hypothetical protein
LVSLFKGCSVFISHRATLTKASIPGLLPQAGGRLKRSFGSIKVGAIHIPKEIRELALVWQVLVRAETKFTGQIKILPFATGGSPELFS